MVVILRQPSGKKVGQSGGKDSSLLIMKSTRLASTAHEVSVPESTKDKRGSSHQLSFQKEMGEQFPGSQTELADIIFNSALRLNLREEKM